MQAYTMTPHKKIQYPHGYYHAHVTPRCHCNARLKPDILCVIGHPYNSPPPEAPTPEITIQYIEFTYCNDRFSTEILERKNTKYQPLINNLITRGWKVAHS